jgi:hypothetical protein
MRKFYYRIVEFFGIVEIFLSKSSYYKVANKKYLTELELATYFGRSTRWVYERLRKGGVLMKGTHFIEVCGVILYDIEQIEADIASGSIR